VADSPWVCDVRVGAVAVYRGPRVNCFGELSEREVVYRRNGVHVAPSAANGHRCWRLPWRYVVAARLLTFWLNLRALLREKEGDYADR
jgi:hypothetical protein